MQNSQDLTKTISRIKVGAFVTVTSGMLLLTLASTLGDDAALTIILGTLTVLFVFGGGLLGLVSMHHVCQTHLPEEADLSEECVKTLEGFQRSVALPDQQRLRPRGFLAMFSLSQDASDDPCNDSDYRKTA